MESLRSSLPTKGCRAKGEISRMDSGKPKYRVENSKIWHGKTSREGSFVVRRALDRKRRTFGEIGAESRGDAENT